MGRSFRELLDDFASDPTRWEVVRVHLDASKNIRNKGGTSVQELLRNRDTGEEIVRHTLLRPDGTVFAAPHFRPSWK